MMLRNATTMGRRVATRLGALLAGLALAFVADAQVVIKLGTIAPEGSVWGDALQRTA